MTKVTFTVTCRESEVYHGQPATLGTCCRVLGHGCVCESVEKYLKVIAFFFFQICIRRITQQCHQKWHFDQQIEKILTHTEIKGEEGRGCCIFAYRNGWLFCYTKHPLLYTPESKNYLLYIFSFCQVPSQSHAFRSWFVDPERARFV